MKPKIILTFDYELFLGKGSGTVQKCLIEPVELLLSLFAAYNGRGIFFIDATYLLTLKKFQHQDFAIVKNQIKKIVCSGNEIGFHLHSQWLDAYPVGNQWNFKTFAHYDLHSLPRDEVFSLFADSLQILEEIAGEVIPGYKVKIFRAGGWLIKPFSYLKEVFSSCGLLIDSSVLPGMARKETQWGEYNFVLAPSDMDCWKFEDDPTVPNSKGSFIELPVTTFRLPGLYLLLNYFTFRDKKIGDGRLLSRRSFSQKLKRIFTNENFVFSSDGVSKQIFSKMIRLLCNRKLATLVCHPKMLTRVTLDNIKYLLQNYEVITTAEINYE